MEEGEVDGGWGGPVGVRDGVVGCSGGGCAGGGVLCDVRSEDE